MTNIIETKNLTKKYRSFTALNNVSLTVEKGAIYGLIGKNGAGKTTLFKLIMGLTKKTSGELIINNNQNLNEARRDIGFMIGPAFFPYMTAHQNIEYYRKLKGIADPQETQRVLKLVELFGVNKPFKAFSMGMKQRLGIANALLGNPPILILDEPINGLDPQGINDIRNLITKLNQSEQTTFIISSHILSELDLVATTFGFIDHGVLLKEVSHDDLHQQTSKALIVEVDQPEKAIALLRDDLGVKDYSEGKNNEIILPHYLTETDKVATLLVNNGLKLFGLKRQETTLEEYFIHLIGGGYNA